MRVRINPYDVPHGRDDIAINSAVVRSYRSLVVVILEHLPSKDTRMAWREFAGDTRCL